MALLGISHHWEFCYHSFEHCRRAGHELLYEPEPRAAITCFVHIHTTACKIDSTFDIGEAARYR